MGQCFNMCKTTTQKTDSEKASQIISNGQVEIRAIPSLIINFDQELPQMNTFKLQDHLKDIQSESDGSVQGNV
ncbi:hypothetical protein SS50377_22905 [Spironucleus salmonicida]|uniref:Uncharacterized protein n=1 Tax=Spironucleus salmonicida TaxID=348837 RepID=V6LWZ4_9EUKA|nr:hypothetical protein SS50377_22905 [Spironucleus salmonicida]|eukprot:EST48753.1 Hypothetical protein SS50377_11075 [Spironucleus salmonicida]